MQGLEIQKNVAKISNSNFNYIASNCKNNYEEDKQQIFNALNDIFLYLPCSFIHYDFIKELANSNNFKNDFQQNFETLKTKIDDSNKALNFLLNVFFLEKAGIIRKEEFKNLLKCNKLTVYNEFISTITPTIKFNNIIQNEESGMNLVLSNIFFDEVIIKDIKNFFENHQNLVKSFQNTNCDVLIAFQIFKNLSFSVAEAKLSIKNYFEEKNYIQLIYAVFLYQNNFEKIFLQAIFLDMSKKEFFLSIFYDNFEEIKDYCKKNEESKKFLYAIIFMIYEQFYYPIDEVDSYYTQNIEYNPSLNIDNKHKFFQLLDEDLISFIMQFSDKKILKNAVDSKFNYLFVNEKEFEVSSFPLKEIIKNQEFHKIIDISKEEFFKAFFYIAKDSISHFLTYLEILKDYFVLSKDEQHLFCTIFEEQFADKKSFKKFICQKLELFNVIDDDVKQNHPILFI
ncbi:hypothetical protein GVAV_001353 [Gurleya vavrai]